MSALRIRPASPDDIDALSAIEAAVFATDRISRRSFRALIARPTAATLVAEPDGGVAGYAMILFRAGTGMARLYSLAVAPEHADRGLARSCSQAAEEAAKRHDRIMLRLEVREDNHAAIGLYGKAGYRQIGRIARLLRGRHGGAALREADARRRGAARWRKRPSTSRRRISPAVRPAFSWRSAATSRRTYLDPVWEIRLWRESTTVFMLAGPGGCEPFGLAVTARAYGLDTAIFCSQPDLLFLDTVRDPEKRKVMELTQIDFRQRAEELRIATNFSPFSLHDIRAAIADGKLVAVLVSGYLMFGKKVPHWVLAHGDDGRHIMIHDPWVEEERGETVADAANLPVPYAVFDQISRFGRTSLRAAVFLEGRQPHV